MLLAAMELHYNCSALRLRWRHALSVPWHARRYESIIATLCENLDTLDEPEAKASMIWIIGEYAERIDNADELLEQFLETFPEEQSMVRGREPAILLPARALQLSDSAWYESSHACP